jgi:guanylate kinase
VKPNGLLLVISGPSGAGKGTICAGLREKLPELAYSVSVTTREPRAGEVDGKDYFFKTVPEVKKMIFEGQLLEHADVYGHIYGTPKPYVMDLLGQGKDVLLEIDIQGALQIKKVFPSGVFVFIVPPSLDELKSRIYKRGKDSVETIKERLSSATKELSFANAYDYIIVNDIVEKATEKVLTILEAERYRADRTYFIVSDIIKQASHKPDEDLK